MRCEDVLETLERHLEDQDSVEYRRAEKHLAACDFCRHASHAVAALREEQRRPVPPPRRDALVRAVRGATERPPRVGSGRRGFWAGVVAGGALAAGIAVAVVLVWPLGRTPVPDLPTVTAAVNEVRSVDLELASPRALKDAEIELELDGSIELEGYAGLRELSWRTDLEAGANQLSLPVVVRGPEGGLVRVVVRDGDNERSFTVAVRAAAGSAPVGRRDGTFDRLNRV